MTSLLLNNLVDVPETPEQIGNLLVWSQPVDPYNAWSGRYLMIAGGVPHATVVLGLTAADAAALVEYLGNIGKVLPAEPEPEPEPEGAF